MLQGTASLHRVPRLETIFMITSEINTGEPGHLLIRSISTQGHPVIVIVDDFEKVPALHRSFPSNVLCLVLDLKYNPSNITRTLMTMPEPNYIIKFPSVEYSIERGFGATYIERERERTELKFHLIAQPHADDRECRILVNVVNRPSEEEEASGSGAVAKNLSGYVIGAMKKGRQADADHSSPSEREPLLPQDEEQVEYPPSPGFLSKLLSFCFPCFFPQSIARELEGYWFECPVELRAEMRSELMIELIEEFRKLHAHYEARWSTTVEGLRRREMRKIRDLTVEVRDQKLEIDRQLLAIEELQKENTRESLAGIISTHLLNKIEETRAKYLHERSSYDTKKVYQEGRMRVTQEIAVESAQLREHHYNAIIEAQIQKLTEIKVKYGRKYRLLYRHYFGPRHA